MLVTPQKNVSCKTPQVMSKPARPTRPANLHFVHTVISEKRGVIDRKPAHTRVLTQVIYPSLPLSRVSIAEPTSKGPHTQEYAGVFFPAKG